MPRHIPLREATAAEMLWPDAGFHAKEKALELIKRSDPNVCENRAKLIKSIRDGEDGGELVYQLVMGIAQASTYRSKKVGTKQGTPCSVLACSAMCKLAMPCACSPCSVLAVRCTVSLLSFILSGSERNGALPPRQRGQGRGGHQ